MVAHPCSHEASAAGHPETAAPKELMAAAVVLATARAVSRSSDVHRRDVRRPRHPAVAHAPLAAPRRCGASVHHRGGPHDHRRQPVADREPGPGGDPFRRHRPRLRHRPTSTACTDGCASRGARRRTLSSWTSAPPSRGGRTDRPPTGCRRLSRPIRPGLEARSGPRRRNSALPHLPLPPKLRRVAPLGMLGAPCTRVRRAPAHDPDKPA